MAVMRRNGQENLQLISSYITKLAETSKFSSNIATDLFEDLITAEQTAEDRL